MKLDLTVPTTLSDIPLHQYQKFVETFEDEDALETYTEEFAGLKMLEIFCGLKTSEALKIKISDLNKIVDVLNNALAEKPSLIQRFKIGKTEFGFVPQLDNMTFGEFIDIENNITNWSTMHAAMAVLYRPIINKHKDKYEIEEYRGDNWHEAMKNMPAAVAVSALVFFYNLENDLLRVTADFGQSKQTQDNKTWTQPQTLAVSGAGTQASTD